MGAVFRRLKGVRSVMPGYAGGNVENPSYQQVSRGNTGHAEVVRIEYDPEKIKYEDLLDVFFFTHDPTTPNRQGADEGEQYRSIVLATTEQQQEEAENYIEKLDKERILEGPIVTEVKKLDKFYEAEDYHKNYYELNKEKFYCQLVINPKINRLKDKFQKFLK